ncbi:MAG: hypothetical protein OXM55_03950 [Bdellovibrionales bacterium]|nr:hypothetical protein [Bdellovibrionales bacterium]
MTPSENKETKWIKDLVRLEQNMETVGEISLPESQASKEQLEEHTVEFMRQLRTAFASHTAVFNHMKGFLGSLRIYGIADTQADFMLFRHGHKLVFSVREPGLISVCMKFNDQLLNGKNPTEEPSDFIKGEWGPFNELKWTYKDQKINIDYLIRYYMTVFVKTSVK